MRWRRQTIIATLTLCDAVAYENDGKLGLRLGLQGDQNEQKEKGNVRLHCKESRMNNWAQLLSKFRPYFEINAPVAAFVPAFSKEADG
jgi:hypothetical protein